MLYNIKIRAIFINYINTGYKRIASLGQVQYVYVLLLSLQVVIKGEYIERHFKTFTVIETFQPKSIKIMSDIVSSPVEK